MVFLLFPMFSIFWWIFTLTFFGWLVFFEERDCPGEALLVLLGYCVLFSLLGDFVSVLSWLAQRGWIVLLLSVLIYLPVGFCWGVFRYWWEQHLNLSRYRDKKVEFLREHGYHTATPDSEVPETLLGDWGRFIGAGKSDYQYGHVLFRKFFYDQKNRIINWMAWWPLSMLSFFLRDFILRFYQILLSKTRKIFEGIERRVWSKEENDFTRLTTYMEEKAERDRLEGEKLRQERDHRQGFTR